MKHAVHRIRLLPTKTQLAAFARHAGVRRWAWNYLLGRFKEEHAKKKEDSSYKPLSLMKIKLEFAQLKKTENFAWLAGSPYAILTHCSRDLKAAYDRFFDNVKKKRRVGKKNPYAHPQFKAKKSAKQTFCPCNGESHEYKVRQRKNGSKLEIYVRGVGWVKLAEKPRFAGKTGKMTVSKDSDGNWYISILFKLEDHELPVQKRKSNLGDVGIDFGLSTTAVLSDGSCYQSNRPSRQDQKRMRRLQRRLERQVKGSKRHARTKDAISKIHFKRKMRLRHSHNVFTNHVVRSYDRIAIEDLNLKGMVHKFGRSVADRALGEIRRQFEYKCEWYGVPLTIVDRFYPSTKTCSCCGSKKDLTLSDRIYECEACGLVECRDRNAALNIRDQIPAIRGEFTHVERVSQEDSYEPSVLGVSRNRNISECCKGSVKTGLKRTDVTSVTSG